MLFLPFGSFLFFRIATSWFTTRGAFAVAPFYGVTKVQVLQSPFPLLGSNASMHSADLGCPGRNYDLRSEAKPGANLQSVALQFTGTSR